MNCCPAKRRRRRWVLGALLLGAWANPLHADPYGLALGPRVAASAGAFAPLSFDHEALFANPAGLASLQDLEVTAQGAYENGPLLPLGGAAVFSVGKHLGLGFYGAWTDRGFLQVRGPGGELKGGIPLRDLSLGMALGLGGEAGFSGGVAVRGNWSSQGDQLDRGLSVDLGGAWQGEQGWQGGLSLQGVAGSSAVFENRVLRWAVARRVGGPRLNVLPALAFSWRAQGDPNLHLGLEAKLSAVALRAGYEQRFVGLLFQAADGLDLGAGVELGAWSLDYALRPASPGGTSQWLSVTWAYLPSSQSPAENAAPALPVAPLGPPPALPEPTPAVGGEAPMQMKYQEDPLKAAKALEEEGRLKEAAAEYERVSQGQPELLGAWRGLADLSYKAGERSRAIAAYEKVLALQPDKELKAWLDAFRKSDGQQERENLK